MKNPLKDISKTILILVIISSVTLSMVVVGATSYTPHNYQFVYAASKNSNSSSSSSPPIGSKTFLTVATKVSGGSSKPSDFTIKVTGNSPSPKSFSGSSGGTSVTLNAGKYKVAASGPADYTSSYSSGCSGTASGGTPVKCTVSNKYTAPAPTPAPGSVTFLNVITIVDNSNGGTKKPSDFAMSVSGKSPSPKSFSGSSSGISVTLNAGKYTVTASGPTGYTTTYSSGCTGTASGGTPVKCTVTGLFSTSPSPNPGAKGFLIVKKIVICPTGFQCPRPGPTSPYKMKVDVSGGVSGLGWNPKTFDGCCDTATGITQVIINLVPRGTANYIVTETDAPTIPGLTLLKAPSAECNGTIQQTQTKYCTFTNEYKSPEELKAEVLVKNHVICPQGFVCPTADKFFNRVHVLLPMEATANPSNFPGSETGTKVNFDFNPGTTTANYDIFEQMPQNPPGLVTIYPGNCVGSLHVKYSNICTFTNEYHQGINLYLYVLTKVICPTGFTCPSLKEFTMNVAASGSGLISWNPKSFPGKDITLVRFITSGNSIQSTVTEAQPYPPLPPGLKNLKVYENGNCVEPIPKPGAKPYCTITNEYS